MAWFGRNYTRLELTIRIEHAPAPSSGLTRIEPPPASTDESARIERSQDDHQRVIIPTDLLFAAWRQLFPAERMVVFGGRHTRRGICVSSLSDVTEPHPSSAHVRACPDKMATSLIDLERTGAHLAVWMHSHPGRGPGATFPSKIDLTQDKDFQRHYSGHLVGIIAVGDGWLRVWGEAVKEGRVRVHWSGRGIESHPGEPHVYRLTLS